MSMLGGLVPIIFYMDIFLLIVDQQRHFIFNIIIYIFGKIFFSSILFLQCIFPFHFYSSNVIIPLSKKVIMVAPIGKILSHIVKIAFHEVWRDNVDNCFHCKVIWVLVLACPCWHCFYSHSSSQWYVNCQTNEM